MKININFIRYFCGLIFFLFFTTIQAENTILAKNKNLPVKKSVEDFSILDGDHLQIEGTNHSNQETIVVVRIDNASSKGYYSRFNKEFTVLPGEFSINIPLNGLKTSAKDILNPPFTNIIVFQNNNADIKLQKMVIESSELRPKNVIALDFGSGDGAVFPMFDKITQASSYLYGNMRTKVRTSGDALIQDGIDGIDLIKVPWENGKWKLSIWLADQGEWEYLAHFLKRKIVANGKVILDQTFNWDDWVRQIYFAGVHKESIIDGNLWECIGKRRNGKVSDIIEITDNQLEINLSGTAEAKFIAAIVLEPIESDFAEQAEDICKEQFLANWPVKPNDYSTPAETSIIDISNANKNAGSYIAAKNTLLNLCFEIRTTSNDNYPFIYLSPLVNSDKLELQITNRYGHWRYERPYPNASVLKIDDSYLRTDLDKISLSKLVPRRIYVQVHIPQNATPGVYSATMQLVTESKLYKHDFSVKVLDLQLPKLSESIGLYVEPPPYYHWFNMQKELATSFTDDLTLLAEYGFSTVAPPLPTPNSQVNMLNFKNMVKQQLDHGFNNKIVAYAPLKRLLRIENKNKVANNLQQLEEVLGNELFAKIYWSVFDEPKTSQLQQVNKNIDWLSQLPIKMKTVGHANSNSQKKLFNKVDMLLVNHGMHLTESKVTRLKKNADVWLYNMDNPRVGAGFYLWKMQLTGYLQWHAHMPTADPFDPTDGREGDLMYLYPPELSSQSGRNIHKRLLDLHEATLDLRWLNWLESQAKIDNRAKKLLKTIEKNISSNWKQAKKISNSQLNVMRQKIIDLADK